MVWLLTMVAPVVISQLMGKRTIVGSGPSRLCGKQTDATLVWRARSGVLVATVNTSSCNFLRQPQYVASLLSIAQPGRKHNLAYNNFEKNKLWKASLTFMIIAPQKTHFTLIAFDHRTPAESKLIEKLYKW